MHRVLAHAKLNLTLEVLDRRTDGFHNLRTVFQTISVADVLDVEARRTKRTRIALESDVEIPGENLIVRAADAVLAAAGVCAEVSFRLKKRIPMGAGMGGGSADAAAVLRALPALLNRPLAFERLLEIGAKLGSDVPCFLIGGTVLGLGRGTELYPLPDLPPLPVLVVAPDVHVSTAEAYRSLGRTNDYASQENVTERFAQSVVTGGWERYCVNDFESAVFAAHPELATLRRRLERAGALVARMTGSGSALFGVFGSAEARDKAAVGSARVFRARFAPRRVQRSVCPPGTRARSSVG